MQSLPAQHHLAGAADPKEHTQQHRHVLQARRRRRETLAAPRKARQGGSVQSRSPGPAAEDKPPSSLGNPTAWGCSLYSLTLLHPKKPPGGPDSTSVPADKRHRFPSVTSRGFLDLFGEFLGSTPDLEAGRAHTSLPSLLFRLWQDNNCEQIKELRRKEPTFLPENLRTKSTSRPTPHPVGGDAATKPSGDLHLPEQQRICPKSLPKELKEQIQWL